MSKAASEEHEGFFIIVCVEERTLDVNCGDAALFVGIDGGGDHNAIGGNCGRGAVFLLVSGLTLFLAAVGTGACSHPSITFLEDIH